MAVYKVKITTGDMVNAGTHDSVFITLIGNEGKSERTHLDNVGVDFVAGKTGCYMVKCTTSLGKLLLIKLDKERFASLPEDQWFCSKILVTTPEEESITFPCYRWVSRGDLVELRGGRAMMAFEEEYSILVEHRKNELMLSNNLYQWKVYIQGVPHMNKTQDATKLPAIDRFSVSKTVEMKFTTLAATGELKLKGLEGSTAKWEDFEAMKMIFWFKKTPMSEYVADHWMEDDFYGYQFLNANNPNVIKRCLELPSNFPVTEEMVKPFLEGGSSLKLEMKRGNIFLCDYACLDGMPTRLENGKPQRVSAGFCLFYMNTEEKLMPIAIQLNQQPSDQNPIFLPTDSESDWLLAKMFVKNSDVILHQIVYHLLNTHFLAEAFAVATFRCFPVIHPLYMLLIPHYRDTLQINIVARETLASPAGILRKTSMGEKGFPELMREAFSKTTYSALCLPDNIAARGLESIPNCYYRDDGLKLWNIIKKYVTAIVENYYPSDSVVCKDSELQKWIKEIFIHGFLENSSSGIPAAFHTVDAVIKLITMVIFRVSAQHAAVNTGQYDYCSWMPNNPLLLHKDPPATKGQSSIKTILECLPNIGETVHIVSVEWLLSRKFSDFVPLGMYDEYFQEPAPKSAIKEFQAELSSLSNAIHERNLPLVLPYRYLDPAEIDNSVAI